MKATSYLSGACSSSTYRSTINLRRKVQIILKYFSNGKARHKLNWQPKYSLQETIKDTIS
jgi:nucleoside-diphosphate-sugar epimerase